jgi:hypothetical protein
MVVSTSGTTTALADENYVENFNAPWCPCRIGAGYGDRDRAELYIVEIYA